MKVLLTGASGFVGSHILDSLLSREIPVAVLLRPSSDPRFLPPKPLETRHGSLADIPSLQAALTGITHVIHCAGCTRPRRLSDFREINELGTRNLVKAVNAAEPAPERLVHISSLAVMGPATPAKPAREIDEPMPISEYGRSKLAGELEVRDQCRVPYTILRPPAVYGPRDQAFLPMFRAVKNHLLPRPNRNQALSLVFVKDLAEAAVALLQNPAAAGRIYFVAAREIVSAREMAGLIAAQMRRWTVPCPVPAVVLWPVCLAQELFSRLTDRPVLLNLAKYAELRAPGWVCDPTLLETETGVRCPTLLTNGAAQTLKWYRENQWL